MPSLPMIDLVLKQGEGRSYRDKLTSFFERLFAKANAGKLLMRPYFDNYYDLDLNLHVGATGQCHPVGSQAVQLGIQCCSRLPVSDV